MFFNGQGLAETFSRPFRDPVETQFPHKMHFLSSLNLKITPNVVHVQSQVCRIDYDAC